MDNKKEILGENLKRIVDRELDYSKLVSIIIVNRNGEEKLVALLDSIVKETVYKSIEIIVVDNNSSDNSVGILEGYKDKLQITIVKNSKNENFSKSNNIGVQNSKGELLVFINNDMEVTYGWLRELIITMSKSTDIGVVGAKLIYPEVPLCEVNRNKSFKVQHGGIAFKLEENNIKPYNYGNGLSPFDEKIDITREMPAVTGACILIKKDVFKSIGGWSEEFEYGYEDVDLCLKALVNKYKVYYCATALLFHHEYGTQGFDNKNEVMKRVLRNRRIFKVKWIKYLKNMVSVEKKNKKKFMLIE